MIDRGSPNRKKVGISKEEALLHRKQKLDVSEEVLKEAVEKYF